MLLLLICLFGRPVARLHSRRRALILNIEAIIRELVIVGHLVLESRHIVRFQLESAVVRLIVAHDPLFLLFFQFFLPQCLHVLFVFGAGDDHWGVGLSSSAKSGVGLGEDAPLGMRWNAESVLAP